MANDFNETIDDLHQHIKSVGAKGPPGNFWSKNVHSEPKLMTLALVRVDS